MENKLERTYSFYRTHRSWNAWRFVCSRRIRRHQSKRGMPQRQGQRFERSTHACRVGLLRTGRESKQRTREESNTKHLSFEGPYWVVSSSPILHRAPPRWSVSQRISKRVTMRHCAILYGISLGGIRTYTGK
jgi:hypothetical protein